MEDQLHVFAHRLHAGAVEAQQILTLQADCAAGGLNQAGDQAAGGGFATAAFADQAQGLALVHHKADVVDSLQNLGLASNPGDQIAVQGKILGEVLNLEQGLAQ